jgi:hypothetical protein
MFDKTEEDVWAEKGQNKQYFAFFSFPFFASPLLLLLLLFSFYYPILTF